MLLTTMTSCTTDWSSPVKLWPCGCMAGAAEFIRSGKPTENGHIKSFNSRSREECLDD